MKRSKPASALKNVTDAVAQACEHTADQLFPHWGLTKEQVERFSPFLDFLIAVTVLVHDRSQPVHMFEAAYVLKDFEDTSFHFEPAKVMMCLAGDKNIVRLQLARRTLRILTSHAGRLKGISHSSSQARKEGSHRPFVQSRNY